MNELTAKILKIQKEREAWLEIHGQNLEYLFIERFGIAFGSGDIYKTQPQYKNALATAEAQAKKYMVDNRLNPNDCAGVGIILIDLRKKLN